MGLLESLVGKIGNASEKMQDVGNRRDEKEHFAFWKKDGQTGKKGGRD